MLTASSFQLTQGKENISGSRDVSVGGLIMLKITFFGRDVSNSPHPKIAFTIAKIL